MKKQTHFLFVFLMSISVVYAQKVPDFWYDCYKLKEQAKVDLEKDQLQYLKQVFVKASLIKSYSPKNSSATYCRIWQDNQEISFHLCSESWSDGLETEYHIHNSELFYRVLQNDKPSWNVVESTEAKENMMTYLRKKDWNLEDLDIFRFGTQKRKGSLGYTENKPENQKFVFGIYNGKTLAIFDKDGKIINKELERGGDYHWGY